MRSGFLFLGLWLILACSPETEKSLDIRKKSHGAYGEIVLVMDTALWEGELGNALKECFRQPFPGLPQAEAEFTLRVVPPESFSGLLRLASNIVVVATFDSESKSSQLMKTWFTDESISKVGEESDLYKYVRRDEFAKDQYSLYLFGENSSDLIQNLNSNCDELKDFFNQRERKRIAREVFSAKEQKGISKAIKEKYGFGFRVPFGYDVAVQEKDFLWMSQLGTDLFRNLFIAWKPYRSEEQFEIDSIVKWRDRIGRKYIFGSGEEDTSSYLITDQRYLEVESRVISFNQNYAIETRGLWRLKNFLRGGPFLSFVLTDPERERIYYIEGFLYAPNQIKKGMMRELEANLYTFQP